MMKSYTYKDSGIEWLGEIPSHWKVDRIKDISSLRDQKTRVKLKDENYLELENIEQGTGKVLSFQNTLEVGSAVMEFKKGDVLFGKLRPYLEKYYLAEKDGYCTGEILAIEPVRINGKFLKYFLASPNFIKQCTVFSYGTKMPRVNWQTQIGIFSIPIPPSSEQKAIVSFLDKAIDRIDRIISIKQMQLVKVKAVFKSKIEHLFSYDLECKSNTKKGLEYLGYIPDLWKVTQLKFVLDFLDSRRIPLSGAIRGEMTEKIFDYYGASGVIDKVEDYIFDEPLILIGEDGANLVTRSKTLVFIAQGKYWVNNHAHILKPKFGDIEFWTYLLENLDYSLFITGAAQPKLSQGNLGKMRIAFPKEESKRKVILDKIKKLEVTTQKQQINLKYQIETLKIYRKSLIHECVTGKKQVTDRVE